MTSTVSYHSGTRYDITSGRHRVTTDQAVEDGGQDAGMSPVELFVGSLAACVAYFIGRFCARHEIPREGLTIQADWEMAEQPHRVGRIALSIALPHPISAEQKERLLSVARGCTIHQSIAVAPTVSIALKKA
ncbi:MAG TPA: OsmC family protein [Nitrospira sp.]|nr:OsmC family protein [Nitrospira sp.]